MRGGRMGGRGAKLAPFLVNLQNLDCRKARIKHYEEIHL